MTEVVKQKSIIMKDQIVHPQKEAVFWVEYILRHKGAPHIRSPIVDLPW